MTSDLDKFVGVWQNEAGNRLWIKKENDEFAFVSFVSGESGRPVCRLYYSDLPSMKMKARLVEWGSTLEVELWKSGKGFSLCLTYEHAYELDEHLREALVPALSRYEEDDYLDQYYELFYPLEHYVRIQGRT